MGIGASRPVTVSHRRGCAVSYQAFGLVLNGRWGLVKGWSSTQTALHALLRSRDWSGRSAQAIGWLPRQQRHLPRAPLRILAASHAAASTLISHTSAHWIGEDERQPFSVRAIPLRTEEAA